MPSIWCLVISDKLPLYVSRGRNYLKRKTKGGIVHLEGSRGVVCNLSFSRRRRFDRREKRRSVGFREPESKRVPRESGVSSGRQASFTGASPIFRQFFPSDAGRKPAPRLDAAAISAQRRHGTMRNEKTMNGSGRSV